ncbi:MAG TPA: hypothetical protein VEP90_09275 [Methylomirabilota bacterium]|nr:hypothetical protein [Methylomirabilota bacterium]
MDNKSYNYNKLLSPELTKSVLMAVAIYLITYELLKSSIIEEIKKFYFVGAGYENTARQRQYASEVLSLDKSPFVASCRWLHKMEAITKEDIQTILNLRELRNKVAHQLPEFLVDYNSNMSVSDLVKMQEILGKVDSWWIREVELAANPDFVHLDHEELETLEVFSGPMIIVSHLIELLRVSEASKTC